MGRHHARFMTSNGHVLSSTHRSASIVFGRIAPQSRAGVFFSTMDKGPKGHFPFPGQKTGCFPPPAGNHSLIRGFLAFGPSSFGRPRTSSHARHRSAPAARISGDLAASMLSAWDRAKKISCRPPSTRKGRLHPANKRGALACVFPLRRPSGNEGAVQGPAPPTLSTAEPLAKVAVESGKESLDGPAPRASLVEKGAVKGSGGRPKDGRISYGTIYRADDLLRSAQDRLRFVRRSGADRDSTDKVRLGPRLD